MERAKEIQVNLSPEHPSFIKVMQRSHVAHTFYMCPPADFCQKHLPRSDEIVVLEVESGRSYDVKFLGMRRAFSGRWRQFSVAEKLLENDILVFHLVGCCKFKVHIVRASGLATVDKAPRVYKSDDCATEKEVEKNITCESNKKRLKFVPVILGENVEVSNSSTKKFIHPTKSNSANIEGSNLKNFEKMRRFLDKSSSQFKSLSPDTMERAKEIQANLSKKHPSFIKLMLKSHLSRPFYMSPPSRFCQKHLPSSDEIVVFEVENGRSYDVKFLSMKRAFSGGWKGFFIAEKLLENDILVFHLVGPCKFKVYIVRASGLASVDIGATVVGIDDYANEKVEVKKASKRDKKRTRFVPVEILRESVEVSDSPIKNSIRPNNSNSSNTEDFPPLQTMCDYEDFKIVVDGTAIEFPPQVRADYFKLCCSRNSYLHRQLIKGIECDLAASIISEMVNISNAIRESKISTPQEDIEYWHKALDGFEAFGMDVGIIRARLNRLSGLASDSKRYKEAEIERDRVEEQIIELKNAKRRLDDEIKGMKKVAALFEVMYVEEANAPW